MVLQLMHTVQVVQLNLQHQNSRYAFLNYTTKRKMRGVTGAVNISNGFAFLKEKLDTRELVFKPHSLKDLVMLFKANSSKYLWMNKEWV